MYKYKEPQTEYASILKLKWQQELRFVDLKKFEHIYILCMLADEEIAYRDKKKRE